MTAELPSTDRRWFKSSYSGGNENACVEVAGLAAERVGARDSKVVAGPEVVFPAAGWAVFVGQVLRD